MEERAMKFGIAERNKPALRLLLTEPARATFELLMHSLQPRPQQHSDASQHPVIIFPGLASNGLPLTPLRRHCRALGHPTCDWGRGFNSGPVGNMGLRSPMDVGVRTSPAPRRGSVRNRFNQ